MVKETMARCLNNVLRLLEDGLPAIEDEGCVECIEAAKGCGAL